MRSLLENRWGRLGRSLFLLLFYVAILSASLSFSYELRFDFAVPADIRGVFSKNLLWFIPIQLLMLVMCGQFSALLTFFGLPDVRRLAVACLVSSLLAYGLWRITGTVWAPPRAVILTNLLLTMGGLSLFRVILRMVREGYFSRWSIKQNWGNKSRSRRVGIIGAGEAGSELIGQMKSKRQIGLDPVAVFDDSMSKWSSQVHGVPIIGSPNRLAEVHKLLKLDEVIVAMPSASRLRIREIVEQVQSLHLPCRILPSLQQVIEGKVNVTNIRPVDIEDLLGRESVALDSEKIRGLVSGKIILVTGAGGSIGAELCRQIIRLRPARLLMVERCEAALFSIEQELVKGGYGSEILPLVMDIRDELQIRGILDRHGPSVLFHAAAHKHVPLMEHQPAEAFRNNAWATYQLARWSAKSRVERFVLISTDKAINPTNVMGVTKRLAEISMQSVQGDLGSLSKFMAVRFGNVLGSSGSVIPTFKRQILEGGPVTVTHPEMTRYFMTIPEAVGLVLQATTLGTGGDIFVLDMGEPIKIVNVARHLIRLSGLEPDQDIEIQFTGLRPGEKLYEELNLSSENIKMTEHPKIRRLTCTPPESAPWAKLMENLTAKLSDLEPAPIKLEFKKMVPEYSPYLQ